MKKLPTLTFLAVWMLVLPAAWGDTVPTEPTLISVDKISAGDTAWMLTSTALVLMMSIPGLALFYGGMVRKKNVLATLMQTFAIVCVVTIYTRQQIPRRLQPRVVRRHDIHARPGQSAIGVAFGLDDSRNRLCHVS